MKALFPDARPRRKSDFYPTRDPRVVPALRPFLVGWPSPIWEPAAGECHLTNSICQDCGFEVVSTDLEDYAEGNALGGMDFLKFTKPLGPSIITNPPFGLADEFIAHARDALKVRYLALLLKVDFFSAARRLATFERDPPTWVLPLTWRVDFTGDGSPPMNCMWVVWTPSTTKDTIFRLLQKPKR